MRRSGRFTRGRRSCSWRRLRRRCWAKAVILWGARGYTGYRSWNGMPPLESQVEVLPASPVSSASTPSPSHVAPHAPLPFLGLACAVSVSTIYYNQPLLLEMARSYGTDIGRTGFVAVATQVGYALGML